MCLSDFLTDLFYAQSITWCIPYIISNFQETFVLHLYSVKEFIYFTFIRIFMIISQFFQQFYKK